MTEERINWYCGVGRTNKSQASLERHGNIAIGHDLLEPWPPGCKRARIGRDKDTGDIVIAPTACDGADTLGVQMPKNDRRAARIASASALKSLGLQIERATACTAQWRGEMLWLSLPAVTDAPKLQRSHAPTPEVDSHAETQGRRDEKPVAAPEQEVTSDQRRATSVAPSPKDDRPPRCCENCTWQKFKLCTCKGGVKANRLVSLADKCDMHFYELHLRRQGETDPRPQLPHSSLTPSQRAASRVVPQTGRTHAEAAKGGKFGKGKMGSRPRATCPIADHEGRTFPISSKGLGKHDIQGRHYLDPVFDKTQLCPGSGKTPATKV
jgi:hypothetical protein